MAASDDFKDYPFLSSDEFQDACHFLDQKYIRATLGLQRRIFRLRLNRNLATGDVYITIICPIDTSKYDITLDLEKLSWGEGICSDDNHMDIEAENNDFEAVRPGRESLSGPFVERPPDEVDRPPKYAPIAQQPYVVYEIHLSETYRTPVLFFTLHDLPPCDSRWDLDVVYRYLVPEEFKDRIRSYGPIGAISVEVWPTIAKVSMKYHPHLIQGVLEKRELTYYSQSHPITGVPTFRVHPCSTPDAMRPIQCSLRDYLQVWLGLVGPCVGLHVPLAMAVFQ
ncbi:MAG: hypothetical protein M1818_001736 [Claussenomyces sp. TS43310]|nr:MAG: hypothetical protein M1818_001736 [Claussenomyces sp. TS43310]